MQILAGRSGRGNLSGCVLQVCLNGEAPEFQAQLAHKQEHGQPWVGFAICTSPSKPMKVVRFRQAPDTSRAGGCAPCRSRCIEVFPGTALVCLGTLREFPNHPRHSTSVRWSSDRLDECARPGDTEHSSRSHYVCALRQSMGRYVRLFLSRMGARRHLPAWYQGRNLADSYYLALPYLSWQGVVLGDPLCSLGKP